MDFNKKVKLFIGQIVFTEVLCTTYVRNKKELDQVDGQFTKDVNKLNKEILKMFKKIVSDVQKRNLLFLLDNKNLKEYTELSIKRTNKLNEKNRKKLAKTNATDVTNLKTCSEGLGIELQNFLNGLHHINLFVSNNDDIPYGLVDDNLKEMKKIIERLFERLHKLNVTWYETDEDKYKTKVKKNKRRKR